MNMTAYEKGMQDAQETRTTREINALNFVVMAQNNLHDPVSILENKDLFLDWYDYTHKKGTILRDTTDKKLYQATEDISSPYKKLEPHMFISAGGWKMIADPSDEYPEWFPASGTFDQWMIDSKCTHNGVKYISKINNNVYEPGAAGIGDNIWQKVQQ